MRTATNFTKQILNESSSSEMIKALDNLKIAWDTVIKIWYKSKDIEDAMLRTTSVYPFGENNMDEIDLEKWIDACKKSIKNLK